MNHTALTNEEKAINIIAAVATAWGFYEFGELSLNTNPYNSDKQAVYTDGDVYEQLSNPSSIFAKEVNTRMDKAGLYLDAYGQGIYLVELN